MKFTGLERRIGAIRSVAPNVRNWAQTARNWAQNARNTGVAGAKRLEFQVTYFLALIPYVWPDRFHTFGPNSIRFSPNSIHFALPLVPYKEKCWFCKAKWMELGQNERNPKI